MSDLSHLKRGSPANLALRRKKLPSLRQCIDHLMELGQLSPPDVRDVCFAGIHAMAKELQEQKTRGTKAEERAAIEFASPAAAAQRVLDNGPVPQTRELPGP